MFNSQQPIILLLTPIYHAQMTLGTAAILRDDGSPPLTGHFEDKDTARKAYLHGAPNPPKISTIQ